MVSTSAFVIAFLCGGVALLITVVLLCIFVRRLKKQVENLATPVYTEAFHDLERLKNKPKKRKKNDYRIRGSPVPRRQPSTLCRVDSNEIVTFVPSGHDKKEVSDPSAQARSNYNGNAPSSSAVESFELKTFAEIHKPGQIDEQFNVGKTIEAFISEDDDFTRKEQRVQDQIHAQNIKKPKLNSPCQEGTQERPESTTNVTAWEKRPRGKSGHSSNSGDLAVFPHSHSSENIVDSSKPNLGISSKQEDNTHVQFAKHLERRGLILDNSWQTNLADPCTQRIDGEQQLYSNQETETMAEFDKVVIQAYSDSEALQNTEKETFEPIYVNVGTHALTNDPEVHLITDQNMSGEFRNSLAAQAVDCSQESNENQNYVIEQNGGQTEYQDCSGQNEYQDYNGQNGYQDYSGQNEYQEYNGQNWYQDYNGQNEYQGYNGQNEYQDYSQNWYQGYNDQNELVDDSGENPEESSYYGNLNQNGDANGLQLEEDGESKYQPLHRQSGEHSNQGFEEEVATEQIYANSAEGEEDNFYVNPNC